MTTISNKWHTTLTDRIYHPIINFKHSIYGQFNVQKQNLFIWIINLWLVSWLNRQLQSIMINIIKTGRVPEHISFIMDGNRTYAKNLNMPIKKGHEAGGITLLSLVYACKRMGVRCVSAYAFSIENFNRPKDEVDTLNNLFADKLDEFAIRAKDFQDPLYGAKIKIVGDATMIGDEMKRRIKRVEKITQDGEDFILYICYPYTSRNDIYHAVQRSVEQTLNNEISKDEITIKHFTENMYLESFSNRCDLLVRTSGHKRLSDYMLWQTHENATIDFHSGLWPDFTFIKLYLKLIKLSLYMTVQNYYETTFLSSEQVLRKKAEYYNKWRGNINLSSLPEPPPTISIVGRKS
ncbi:hypothetical protein Kpol_1033p59 [Vanderwaltozyma polyspora DSM 70294]|uniref:Alkyl transferase n=1 Tax=Vanderwaltozyma polyspora (strain ATCC 22028 / DSM 70294 / BCRC 21397 / CBS 2163 / NBRC 10782 / NRRL Y-8283 / UCD 57-17) TaxID=436907 RepID=A7TJ53_VANPO|nr:uncharacterized protein Kpol_1033p59 [Vanderwaltozyma polyspora DSM 70294]EDO17752.1 hypothetical protein Kpol_1033p59 [Vanderwaltozyma polyspora DSM 70294]